MPMVLKFLPYWVLNCQDPFFIASKSTSVGECVLRRSQGSLSDYGEGVPSVATDGTGEVINLKLRIILLRYSNSVASPLARLRRAYPSPKWERELIFNTFLINQAISLVKPGGRYHHGVNWR